MIHPAGKLSGDSSSSPACCPWCPYQPTLHKHSRTIPLSGNILHTSVAGFSTDTMCITGLSHTLLTGSASPHSPLKLQSRLRREDCSIQKERIFAVDGDSLIQQCLHSSPPLWSLIPLSYSTFIMLHLILHGPQDHLS